MGFGRPFQLIPFLLCIDTQDVFCLDSSVVLPNVVFRIRFLRLDSVQCLEDIGLVEIEKHEIYRGLVGHLWWLRDNDVRKLSDENHWGVGCVIAISWFLCAAFLRSASIKVG